MPSPTPLTNGHRSQYLGTDAVSRRDPALPVKIALYSHDAMGIGHVRRNLLIAQALSRQPVNATTLLICGVHEASAFTGGSGVDCLTLPSFRKYAHDDYRPRDLKLPGYVVSEIRAQTLQSALMTMEPDLMIVDKVPKGLHGELQSTLPLLRARGTRIVFGLRDVLDSPERVADEWTKHGYLEFVRDHYDEVWVYGEQAIFDPVEAYGWDQLRDLVRYTGYFDQRERLSLAARKDVNWRAGLGDLSNTVLCMVGGGQDGGDLARSFARAALPEGMQGLLITGPLMDAAEHAAIEAIAVGRKDLDVLRHVPDADVLMPDVARVICMGGYNSMLSVVSFNKPGLIVPRVHPRQEQKIRAEKFQKLGWLDWLHPSELSPAALSSWLANGHTEKENGSTPIVRPRLNGLSTIQDLTTKLVRPQASKPPLTSGRRPVGKFIAKRRAATAT